jgi:sporulation protein YlmC with PRC-barrel domain
VTGVIIERPVRGADGGFDAAPQATPEEGALEGTTPTPELDENGFAQMGPDGPRVVYLLVDVMDEQQFGEGAADETGSQTDDTANLITPTPQVGTDTGTNPFSNQTGGMDVLIPWHAFDFSGLAFDLEGETGRGQFFGGQGQQDGDLTVTPTPGLDDGQDNTQDTGPIMTMQDRVLVLNIDADVVAAAPTLSDLTTDIIRVPGWDAQLTQYWGQYGVGPVEDVIVPETGQEDETIIGARQTHEIVLLRDEVFVMDLADESGMTIGQIDDFVVDLNTGELIYAVLTGQGTLDGQMFLVPFSHLNWQGHQPAGDGFGDPGRFNTAFPAGDIEPLHPWFDNSPEV